MRHCYALAAFALAGLVKATISNFRVTIPGSLHQCDATNFFFFDTDDPGNKTVLFVSPASAGSLGTGILNLQTVLASTPIIYQVDGINSADAAEFDFTLQIAAGTAFSTLAFLSTGQGKNVDLDRTVMQPLPGNANCLTGAAAVPSSSSTAASSPSSGFVTSTISRPLSSVTTSVPTPISSFSSAAQATVVVVPTAPPAVVSTAAADPSSTTSAPTAASTIVITTDYLLTSFISLSTEATIDGTITSNSITGGHVTGTINATILTFGSALFTANTTIATSTGNATNAASSLPLLVSATYSMLTNDGQAIFVMAQTPLSANATSQALVMTFQSTNGNATAFGNSTVLGKPEFINSTMLRIDAYSVEV
ncbi:MAG: hypothetical protein CYPHOPRED_000691 [Cyphobasidiales sp. Tagirdzhanova-0007]|nr:MAG: hypothetical protein CYPHOPRED_000691 [Cyphobasidiales sp. Tagirdzhanova-0007]